MKVLLAASECAPMIKVGGLGDVIGSLPKALAKEGVAPAVIVPRYEIIETKNLKKAVRGIKVIFKKQTERIDVYQGVLPKTNIPIFYIENKRYLSKGGPVYFSKTAIAEENIEFDRFHFFSHAVYELLFSKKLLFQPDVVHTHDWHTGILAVLLKISSLNLPTVFSIHNLANQGVFKNRNSIVEGIKNATAVSTVSRTYAKEIQTKEYGAGLEKLLKKIRPVGILNGIDYQILEQKYDKAAVKRQLQKELKLAIGLNYPIFGLVARLVEQKGIHLITPLVKSLVEKYQAQFVFLGVGQDKYEQEFKSLAKKYPKNVSANILFSEDLARKIYIGSDFFLMPSIFEPSGLGQMISMYYGTLPIVRATGGLKDTVQEGKTGFVFSSKRAADLGKAMERAIKVFRNQKRLLAMRKLCQKQDFSWKQSAKKYKNLYERIL